MVAKDPANWRFDPLNRQRANDGYFEHFTRNIFHITNPQAPIQHRPRLIKSHHTFQPYLLDQLCHDFILDQIYPQYMIFRLDSVITGLLLWDALNNR